ncbi:RagB/SusD family nutrient uptake outer membrane protein [Kaistella flava (ex Peng et al. 2021)]|uniref:RagB/SusD family nutrient uptake outer membrane protein n=1 Tax=Kaistella flava (ex Peng et al. 2021) TaxID=2038776 RepID=A0A7M2Y9S2_9FLAO|nr:RagB/SusD family nutrient uptake outer membrane protein [Kaistella flava (ex Peng et al. 2021)]QOW10162.1 RagB/SusD family nutrient uptake outer membrane protein [Kaistella flava (ex Peng et al. 2021)]
MKTQYYFNIIALLASISFIGCNDFLDERSDLKLAIPETVEANQALIDNYNVINFDFATSGETSTDDFYLAEDDYNGLIYEEQKRLYMWKSDHVSPTIDAGNDWFYCYQGIYYANSVLYNLEKYNLNGNEANNVRGQALALRASRYLDGAQLWCLAYDKSTSEAKLGLPLRLDPDMNYVSERSTLEETYQQILKDLHEAVNYLPVNSLSVSRMSKPAALGLLSRTYLFMGDYSNSLKYGLEAISYKSSLMNYNNLEVNSNYPISNINAEIIFRSSMRYETHLLPAKINLELYNTYNDNDLRRKIFFRKSNTGEILFKGNYNEYGGLFNGISTNELLLNISECYARLGDANSGINYLNDLLKTRWITGKYITITANNSQIALQKILDERRKELLMRGLRWSDIKRLNRDGAGIVLTRNLMGETLTLPPNDLRYAIAIPEEVVKLTGMKQNER